MDEVKKDDKKQKQFVVQSGLMSLAHFAFAGFLVWCTFNYPMSETMRTWFFVWAVLCSL